MKTVDANSFSRPVMLPRRKEYGHGTSKMPRRFAYQVTQLTEGDMRLSSSTGLRRKDRVAFDEILHILN